MPADDDDVAAWLRDGAIQQADPPNVVKFEQKKPDLRAAAAALPESARLLPQSIESEKALISSFFLSPDEVGSMCAEKGLKPEFFHMPAHQDIFRALMSNWDQHKGCDFVSVTHRLMSEGKIKTGVEAAYITELSSFLPTASCAENYWEHIKDAHQLRQVVTTGTQFAAKAYEAIEDVAAFLDDYEKRVMAIRDAVAKSTLVDTNTVIMDAMAAIQKLYDARGTVTGIPTGFTDLDRMLNGLQPELFVIAARPSMGKTAFAMNMADYIAVDLKRPVGVFSLEMTEEQLGMRMLSSRAHVNMVRIREGTLSERDFPAIQRAANAISAAPLHLDFSKGITIQELRGKARMMVRKFGVEAIFVDYIQKLRSTSKRAQNNREQEVSEISNGLADLSKELKIAVIVLAQLKREAEGRRPTLRDLRESGSIEQDADTVGFLSNPEDEGSTDKTDLRCRTDLIIAKQRNGPLGDVPLMFLKEFTSFQSLSSGPDYETSTNGELKL